jgi:hypothetical protein
MEKSYQIKMNQIRKIEILAKQYAYRHLKDCDLCRKSKSEDEFLKNVPKIHIFDIKKIVSTE